MRAIEQVILLGLPLFLGGVEAWGCSNNSTANELAAGWNLDGKVAVVTGGDSGLGLAAAEAFARAGATVVIAGHNADKTQAVAANLSLTLGADVRGISVDLSSFESVRSLALNISKVIPGPLDFLVNDAGILTAKHGDTTKDGFETIFATNFLGHFLLTELLLPDLRKSGAGRVVNVASTAAETACSAAGWPEDCLKDFSYLPPPSIQGQLINGTTRKVGLYGLSKFMMIQHAAELSMREMTKKSGVQAFSVGPGVVDTGITPEFKIKKNCDVVNSQSDYNQHPCPYTSGQGAAVIMLCSLGSPRQVPDLQPGGWFLRYTDCREDPPVNMQGFTPTLRSEFYSRALQWVGVSVSQASDASSIVI